MKKLFTKARFNKTKSRDFLPLECKNCRKKFLVQKRIIQIALKNSTNNNTTGEFCSKQCVRAHFYPPLMAKCKQCNKDYRIAPSQKKRFKNNFCSHSCSAKYNNPRRKNGVQRSRLEIWIESQLKVMSELHIEYNNKNIIGSELDIYIPSLQIAFEINGIVHYEPIFGMKKLLLIKENDLKKITTCSNNGIKLYIINVSKLRRFNLTESLVVLKEIYDIICLNDQEN